MENPATWGPAEKIVHDVLNEQDNILPRLRPSPGEVLCGLSLERQITDALREAGLLKEEHGEEEEDGGAADHQPDREDRGQAGPEV